MKDKGPDVARLAHLAMRVELLLAYWGTRSVAEITLDTCKDYVTTRGRVQAAGRELDDLKAACNHYCALGLCNAHIRVTRPKRSEPRLRWLTRDEAARLIRAAWRYKQPQPQNGAFEPRAMRKHLARFILVGLYTGTRSGAISTRR